MKKLYFIYISFLVLINFNNRSYAQAGSIDPTFNSGDAGFNHGYGFDLSTTASALQPDGKIIVAGLFTNCNGTLCNGIVRLNQDGTIDNTFSPPAGAGFANQPVNALVVQSDGKIIAAGSFTSFNSLICNRIIRFNSNGSIDNTYTTGTGFNGPLYGLTLQPDGKLIACGEFQLFNGSLRNRIVRINVNGSIDNTLSIGSGFLFTVNTVALQTNGKIIAGGNFTSYNGTSGINRIARINSNGSIDSTFMTTGTGFDNTVQALSIQPDGNIIAAGLFTNFNGQSRNGIARVTSTGSIDGSFNPGTGFNNIVTAIALQTDGNIIAAGNFTLFNNTSHSCIVRLTGTGASDVSYVNGTGFDSIVNTLLIQPDNKIIAGGNFTRYSNTVRKHIARLATNGTGDITFFNQSGADAYINPMVIQPDGKIIIGGGFTLFNGYKHKKITRLNTDGTVDTTFSPGTGFNGDLWTLVLQPDGKIIASGFFSQFNGSVRNCAVRLNTNGSLDTTFNIGTGFSNSVDGCTIQPDGKIIFCGSFATYNGVARNAIVRVNPNGSLDLTFNIGSGFNSSIADVMMQPDGKIIACGNFTTYNGVSRSKIARLNSDGTLDNTFNPGLGFNGTVLEMLLQPDGKIISAGSFSTFNGTVSNNIARLNTNGTPDITFNTGTGFNGLVSGLAIQPDGKLIVGGLFTAYNGIARNNIIRLNTNGTNDPAFNPGSGADNKVWQCAMQADGKVIITGSFSSFNGVGRNRIARLFAYSSPLPIELISFNVVNNSQNEVTCNWTTASEMNNDFFTVEKSKDGIHFEKCGTVNSKGNSNAISEYSFPDNQVWQGTTYYRLKQTDYDGLFSYSKTAVINLKNENTFTVYPTIANEEIHVTSETENISSEIFILDANGNVMKKLSGIINNTALSIQVADLKPGIYFLSFVGGNKKEVYKFVKS